MMAPESSILVSTKAALGMTEDYKAFDPQIIMHINSIFSILQQMGVGPKEGFSIKDDSTFWSEYTENEAELQMVQSYMYCRVRILFDPPMNASLLDALKTQYQELEWRLNVAVDPGKKEVDADGSD